MKVKASHSHKGPYDFDLLVPVQELTSQKMVSLIISLHVFIFVYLMVAQKLVHWFTVIQVHASLYYCL